MNRKLFFILFAVVIGFFLTGCFGKDYGAYWTFGKSINDLGNRTFLASDFDCLVTPSENMYEATCTQKDNGDVYNMIVPYYRTGEHWIIQ
jgi:hypothetical protein